MIDEKVTFLVKACSLRAEKIGQAVLESYGITHQQYMLLRFIILNEPVRQIDIEKFFLLSNPTVTGILSKLEAKGYIIRVKNPTDSRSKLVSASEMTKNMQEKLLNLGPQIEEELTDQLSESEYETIIRILKKIAR